MVPLALVGMSQHVFYQPLQGHGHGMGWGVVVLVLVTSSFRSDFLNFQIQVLLYFSTWQTSKLFQKWSDFQNFSDFRFLRFREYLRLSELFSFKIFFRGLFLKKLQFIHVYFTCFSFKTDKNSLQFCLISLSLLFHLRPRNTLAAAGSL